MRRGPGALAADVACVLAFALAGRASHAEHLSPAGVLATGGPFLAALVLGWAFVGAVWRRPPVSVADGVVLWLVTVTLAMGVRRLTGAGTDPAFVVVAALVLGTALIGWRVAADAVRPRRWRPTWGRRWSGRPDGSPGRSSRPR